MTIQEAKAFIKDNKDMGISVEAGKEIMTVLELSHDLISVDATSIAVSWIYERYIENQIGLTV